MDVIMSVARELHLAIKATPDQYGVSCVVGPEDGPTLPLFASIVHIPLGASAEVVRQRLSNCARDFR
jgi:hypothetical protein